MRPKSGKEIKCRNCGTLFYIEPRHVGKRTREFCGYTCAMDFRKGKKRPACVRKKIRETKLKRILTIANSSRKRAIYLFPKRQPCEMCFEDNLKRIDRHHKDFNPFNNNKNNIQFLCKTCHQRLHKNWQFRWNKKR